MRDDQAARVYAIEVSHTWNEELSEISFYNDAGEMTFYLKDTTKMTLETKNFLVIGDPFGQAAGGLDDHVLMDELTGGNDQPAFVSVGASSGTTHTAAEGTDASPWLEARYESFLGAYQGLQTQVVALHEERNVVELKCNELRGMVLRRDGNIKLFMR
ncbi:hypothetical protein Tco_0718157 [Tanacetum coccineum]